MDTSGLQVSVSLPPDVAGGDAERALVGALRSEGFDATPGLPLGVRGPGAEAVAAGAAAAATLVVGGALQRFGEMAADAAVRAARAAAGWLRGTTPETDATFVELVLPAGEVIVVDARTPDEAVEDLRAVLRVEQDGPEIRLRYSDGTWSNSSPT